MYIFNRRQDEELDALSASVQRIEGVGLTIHDELVGQVFPCCMYNSSYGHPLPRSLFHAEVHILLYSSSNFQILPRASIYILFPIIHEKLLGELNLEMETTSNRLDFVQVCIFCSISIPFVMSLLHPFPLIFSTVQRASHEIACLPR